MDITLEEIIQECSGLVFYLVSRGIPESDVDDVTQEVWLGVWKGLEGYRGDASLDTWVGNISRNRIAEYYRRAYVRKKYLAEVVSVEIYPRSAFNLDDRYVIPDVIARMPANYGDVIYKRFVLGMDFSEIAESNDMKYECARSLYRRAISYIQRYELVERV